MLLGASPLRLSFAGGGTDLKEYYENFGGSVISTAINHFTYVIVTPREDKSFQMFSSDFQVHFKLISILLCKGPNLDSYSITVFFVDVGCACVFFSEIDVVLHVTVPLCYNAVEELGSSQHGFLQTGMCACCA